MYAYVIGNFLPNNIIIPNEIEDPKIDLVREIAEGTFHVTTNYDYDHTIRLRVYRKIDHVYMKCAWQEPDTFVLSHPHISAQGGL